MDIGEFSVTYSGCYRCASESGAVHVTYQGHAISWNNTLAYVDGSRITAATRPELDKSGQRLTDGETFRIRDRNAEVHGTIQLYYEDKNGNRILVATYKRP